MKARRRNTVGLDQAYVQQRREAERQRVLFESSDFQTALDGAVKTRDSFQNFQLALGQGTNNALSSSTYGFNPITRNRTLLEWIHRGSWLGGVAIEVVADDMTRAGIEITSDLPTDDEQGLHSEATIRDVWTAIGDTVRWSRLYGGAIGVMLIDGQKLDTPLRLDTVGKGQFKGILVLDRWAVDPSLGDLVTEFGPDMGLPKYYTASSWAPGLTGRRIHYSRVLRMDGVRLPYTQRMMENLWGISVLERLYDRMVAFDSATTGAAQAIYKSHLRVYKVEKLRELIASSDELTGQLVQYVQWMQKFQGVEGVTLIDSQDDFVGVQGANMAGFADALVQFGQQLAGALQIPLVRLFGMSPAGFSSTGESDLKTYYDGIKQRQVRDLTTFVSKVYRTMAASLGIDLGNSFDFEFRPLWQMTDEQRAGVGRTVTETVATAQADGLVSHKTALMELKTSSRITGLWTSITEEDIEEAEAEDLTPPNPDVATLGGSNGGPDLNGEEPDFGHQTGPGGGSQVMELTQRPTDRPPLRLVGRDALPLGLDLYIETPKGTPRYPWQSPMGAHYGFLRGTEGADGEEVDCFVGPEPEAGHDAWVIDQVHPDTGNFDEHKCMLGFPTRALAVRAYTRSFDDHSGPQRIGSVTRMPIPRLKEWLADRRKTTRPAA